MIPTLISLAKNKIDKIISWFTRNYKVIAVIIITILAAFLFYLNNQLVKKNKEIDRVTGNYLYYESLATLLKDNNRVLLLTLNEFKETKDSVVLELRTTVKKLKIKEKELKEILTWELTITMDTTIVVKTCDFNVEIKPNNQTYIQIIKKDTCLTHKLDIKNSPSLVIYNKKRYKRQYKNWFLRLLHFDFKKTYDTKYLLLNSNDKIKNENVRIIHLSK